MSRQWWSAGLWAFVILVLCLIPGRTLPQWHWFDLFNVDKLVHAGMFFVLAVLLAQALRVQGARPKYFLPGAAVICACYGVLTEVLQRVEGMGRVMDPTDMIADAFGAIIAAWFMNWCLKRGKEYLPFAFLR